VPSMWNRQDWRAFYRAAKGRAGLSLPPRPLYHADRNRLVPAEGFSLDELLAAGVSLSQAEGWGLPVDLMRVDACEPNVAALRVYARATRVNPS
jgi:ribosomal protein L13E